MDAAGQFTYDSALISPRDRMRHALGDTNPNDPLRWDETYDAALQYYGDETLATAKMARALAAQFGRQLTTFNIPGGPSGSYSDRVRTWTDTAKTLETATAATGSSAGYTAGIGYRAGISDTEQQSEYHRTILELPEREW